MNLASTTQKVIGLVEEMTGVPVVVTPDTSLQTLAAVKIAPHFAQVHIVIIGTQGMDSSKPSMKWKKKERLVDLILPQVETRATRGDTFRDHGPGSAKVGEVASSRGVHFREG
ncbi:MAG: hypothetical protein NTV38_11785 [Chloroflexi bacterium]|nr:hypothetical protein [Chloroflexota bacterium]